ncbi:cell wall-binding repeat-containing protein [Euzebya rosea]|uniref:cell wall-binding repeat-containing protein n=1 Tax=Euzebya rosea TaxID=2052804 RepID=UPI000D3ED9B2|nr:cell wall-binding repeat-containing protein [Euzebya rosea]
MLRRPALRVALPAALLVLLLVTTALPGGAQTELPSVEDLLGEVGELEGLNALDPILNPVSELVLTTLATIDDTLADAPLVNALALGGDDAIDAGVAFSQATFPDGAGTAILSREDLFADGFSSGAFQGVNDAPLLFTDSDDLDPRTGLELMRLGMTDITILGGDRALNPLVVQKLEIAGLTVTRVGGPTRVETAVETARATNPGATTALLVRAYPDAGQPDDQAYADLLAAGPYAAENGWPILMTPSDGLHPATAEYLSSSTITDVVIIGGTGAVSQATEDAVTALGLSASRVAGDNRYATAVAIANARGFTSSADADRLILAESRARDDVWAPGFAATAHGTEHAAPVLLVDGLTIPAETLTFVLEGMVANLLDGGPAVICASFVDSLACRAVALLMVGNVAGALELVSGLLDMIGGLPILGDLLTDLGLAGLLPGVLQSLTEALEQAGATTETLENLLGAVASGDPAAAQAALEEAAGSVGEDVTDLVGGALGGLLGGGSGGSDGSGGSGDEDGSDGGNPVDDLLGGLLGGGN